METVFDLATHDEIIVMFGADDPELPEHLRGYALDRKLVQECPNTNFHHLALLYAERGDLKKADHYLAQIDDPQYRLSCQLLIYEEVG
jgi:hypothetical protein